MAEVDTSWKQTWAVSSCCWDNLNAQQPMRSLDSCRIDQSETRKLGAKVCKQTWAGEQVRVQNNPILGLTSNVDFDGTAETAGQLRWEISWLEMGTQVCSCKDNIGKCALKIFCQILEFECLTELSTFKLIAVQWQSRQTSLTSRCCFSDVTWH